MAEMQLVIVNLHKQLGGSSTPSGNSAQGVSSQGAKGDTDTTVTGIFSTLLQAIIGQATALQTTLMNNQTSMEITKMMNDTALKTGQIGANAMMNTANINAYSNQLLQSRQQAFEEYMKKTYPQSMTGGVSALVNNFHEWLNGQSDGGNAVSHSKFAQAIRSIGLSIQYTKSLDWNDPKNWGLLGQIIEKVKD